MFSRKKSEESRERTAERKRPREDGGEAPEGGEPVRCRDDEEAAATLAAVTAATTVVVL